MKPSNLLTKSQCEQSTRELKIGYQKCYLLLQKRLLASLLKETDKVQRKWYREAVKKLGETYQEGLGLIEKLST